MALPVRRRGKTQFERASDGSMTLLDHLRELRTRLFKAALAIVCGMIVGWFLSKPVLDLLETPYCNATKKPGQSCGEFLALDPTGPLALQVKVALIVGLIVAAPFWLYQLWAFIAPGLHRSERRWAYAFATLAAPLFALGAWLAYIMLPRALDFLLNFGGSHVSFTFELSKYIGFVTNLVLLFGLAFEFPLVVMLFNIAGLASAKRLVGWWRPAILVFFVFAAIAIPTGDPFTMTVLALGLTALYFGAVLFAYFNDKRRARRHRATFGDVGDDEVSPLDYDNGDPVEAGEPVSVIEPVAPPRPLDRHFDDIT
ncbi:twin-arginine translocase subunit TatC [Rugosimonospora acidiphila]|uniref:Sec-independent protein translocase protein TatC n=1 Tax=Rugosimonospora acidiphila TaxID=556531 RepID=A0ABP9RM89_9ACTN